MAYTDDQKQEAVDLYASEGMAEAHRRTGIPKPSIKRWADEAGVVSERSDDQTKAATAAHVAKMADERRQARAELAESARHLLARIRDEETPSKCQSLAVSAAILIDKWQVIGWGDGEPEADTDTSATPDLERMRAEAVARGEHLTAVV